MFFFAAPNRTYPRQRNTIRHLRHHNATLGLHPRDTGGMQTLTVVSVVDQETDQAHQARSRDQGETWMMYSASNAARKATMPITVSHSHILSERIVVADRVYLSLGNNKNRPGNRGGLERQRRYGGEND
jgi:hypothetical protein